jgi:hypothetical protein
MALRGSLNAISRAMRRIYMDRQLPPGIGLSSPAVFLFLSIGRQTLISNQREIRQESMHNTMLPASRWQYLCHPGILRSWASLGSLHATITQHATDENSRSGSLDSYNSSLAFSLARALGVH